jgi:aryl-alcohol dehydrogenase-like predicted oxidoreductase
MGISSFYGTPPPDQERFKVISVSTDKIRISKSCKRSLNLPQLLDAVYAAGCTNWDTADAYGDSEELIGRWYALFSRPLARTLVYGGTHTHVPRFKRTGKRDEIFIATKFGAGSPSGKIIDGSPAYVNEACQKSLEKLGVDQIDLYYAHR